MDFLSIHELSTQFDTPARVIRYRFHKLRLTGKLAEGVDYRRENFVDEQHFEWRINPLSFMRETGMALSPVAKRTPPAAAGNSVATKENPVVTQMDKQLAPTVDQSAAKAASVDNQPPDMVAKPINQTEPKPAPPGIEREMITVTTTIDHEVRNVAKCVKAEFAQIAIIGVSEAKLTKLAAAVAASLGEAGAARVGYFLPEAFLAFLQNLPPPAPPEPTTKTVHGYKVKTNYLALSPEEAKAREDVMIKSVADSMKKPPRRPAR